MTSILLSKRVVKVNKMLMFLESRTTCHIKIITDQYHPVKKGVKVSSWSKMSPIEIHIYSWSKKLMMVSSAQLHNLQDLLM